MALGTWERNFLKDMKFRVTRALLYVVVYRGPEIDEDWRNQWEGAIHGAG